MENWKEILQQVLVNGLSQRGACEKYQLGRQTLKNILSHSEPPGYRQREARPRPVLAPVLPIIHEILVADQKAPKKQRHTAKRIFERLKAEYGYLGVKTVDEDAQGKRVRFFRVTELITQLLEAKEERQLQRYRQALSKLDLLVLDELGYVPASKAGAELLFDVIATVYERYSLIVTTNLPFENWTEVLGSERLTGAALDRLTHRCHILETKGEGYRLQDAKRRRKPG